MFLGYIAKVKATGRHEISTFPYAITLDEGTPVAGLKDEKRHCAIFVDNPFTPSRFALAKLYDPEEVDKVTGRVSLDRLAELWVMASNYNPNV